VYQNSTSAPPVATTTAAANLTTLSSRYSQFNSMKNKGGVLSTLWSNSSPDKNRMLVGTSHSNSHGNSHGNGNSRSHWAATATATAKAREPQGQLPAGPKSRRGIMYAQTHEEFSLCLLVRVQRDISAVSSTYAEIMSSCLLSSSIDHHDGGHYDDYQGGASLMRERRKELLQYLFIVRLLVSQVR
jgi:hypothetical protein